MAFRGTRPQREFLLRILEWIPDPGDLRACADLTHVRGDAAGARIALNCNGSDWPSRGGANIAQWAQYHLLGTGGSHAGNRGSRLDGVQFSDPVAASYYVR